MPTTSQVTTRWQCDVNEARLTLPAFSATVELPRPAQGLHAFSFNGAAPPDMRLLCIESNPAPREESITDQYIRESDLVVRYAQTSERPVSMQVYWRAFEDGQACGVDQLISTQTDQLDSDPTLRIENHLPGGQLVSSFELPSSILFRPSDTNVSLLLAAHPADCEALDIQPGDITTLVRFALFRPGLEKGVIRRARLRAAILPRDDDETSARELHHAFLTSELPLTT